MKKTIIDKKIVKAGPFFCRKQIFDDYKSKNHTTLKQSVNYLVC